jgi:hypothetical protein
MGDASVTQKYFSWSNGQLMIIEAKDRAESDLEKMGFSTIVGRLRENTPRLTTEDEAFLLLSSMIF